MNESHPTDNRRKAVNIERVEGQTMVIGDEPNGEWITTKDMKPLPVEEYR